MKTLNVMTIEIREFTRNIYKYLKPGVYVVTKHGVEHLRITIDEPNVATSLNVLLEKEYQKKDIETLPSKVFIGEPKLDRPVFTPNYVRDISHYGCGCVKDKAVLCKAHGRY